MKRLSVLAAGLVLLSIAAVQAAADSKPARLMVKFKARASLLALARAATPRVPFAAARLAEAAHADLSRMLAGSGISALIAVKPDATLEPLAEGIERLFVAELAPATPPADALAFLRAQPGVEYAEPDYPVRMLGGVAQAAAPASGDSRRDLIPSDPFFSVQWGLRNTGQDLTANGGLKGTAGGDINAPAAWDITTGSTSVILAVLDTGLASNATEFSGRLLPGRDYVNNDDSPEDDSTSGHGTAVAGAAAATGNNGSMIAGVDWKCRIMPIKVLDAAGSGVTTNVALGITYAVNNGAKVLNLSLAGSEASQGLLDAVRSARSQGAIIVAGMGNENVEAALYPAAYPEVIAVGATNSKDERAVPFTVPGVGTGSTYGAHIDFVAPGDFLVGLTNASPTQGFAWSGTSVATPMVSGTVALLFSVNPRLTFEQAYAALRNGARDRVGPAAEDVQGWDKYYGWGRIDAARALQALPGTSIYFSQAAVGGGYKTIFTALNTGATNATATLTLNPVNATFTAPGSQAAPADRREASSASFTIPPGGVQIVTANPTNPSDPTSTGWAKLTSSEGSVGGVATFQLQVGNTLQAIAGVLGSGEVENATIPVDDDLDQNRYTGYAIANTGTENITIGIVTVSESGQVALRLPEITLVSGEHKPGFLFQLIKQQDPSYRRFRGSMVLMGQGGKKFAVVALVQDRGQFTAIPVVPAKAAHIN